MKRMSKHGPLEGIALLAEFTSPAVPVVRQAARDTGAELNELNQSREIDSSNVGTEFSRIRGKQSFYMRGANQQEIGRHEFGYLLSHHSIVKLT